MIVTASRTAQGGTDVLEIAEAEGYAAATLLLLACAALFGAVWRRRTGYRGVRYRGEGRFSNGKAYLLIYTRGSVESVQDKMDVRKTRPRLQYDLERFKASQDSGSKHRWGRTDGAASAQ